MAVGTPHIRPTCAPRTPHVLCTPDVTYRGGDDEPHGTPGTVLDLPHVITKQPYDERLETAQVRGGHVALLAKLGHAGCGGERDEGDEGTFTKFIFSECIYAAHTTAYCSGQCKSLNFT